MKKKQASQLVAALVSICAVVCILNFVNGLSAGGGFPLVELVLSVVLLAATVLIWRNVRNMEE